MKIDRGERNYHAILARGFWGKDSEFEIEDKTLRMIIKGYGYACIRSQNAFRRAAFEQSDRSLKDAIWFEAQARTFEAILRRLCKHDDNQLRCIEEHQPDIFWEWLLWAPWSTMEEGEKAKILNRHLSSCNK